MTNNPSSLRTRASVRYVRADAADIGKDVLGVVVFGQSAATQEPNVMHVSLVPAASPAVAEVWQGRGPIRRGRSGAIRYAEDGERLFGMLELDEAEHGGLEAAAEAIYRGITAFLAEGGGWHLLRTWNYLDAINEGAGDEERYKRFCLGRARGFGPLSEGAFPAATAVGRRDGRRVLQACWLAARQPGRAVENPRQLAAYRYPRCYGPVPPSFCRATITPERGVLVSGTASIVGSESLHDGDLLAQLRETAENLRQVLRSAAACGGPANAMMPPGTVLKTYLRDFSRAGAAEEILRTELGGGIQVVVLEADICRAELLVEVECACDYPDDSRG